MGARAYVEERAHQGWIGAEVVDELADTLDLISDMTAIGAISQSFATHLIRELAEEQAALWAVDHDLSPGGGVLMARGSLTIPNPDRLPAAACEARGLARFEAAYRESPLLAVLIVSDTVSTLLARPGAEVGEAINPLGVMMALGAVVPDAQWPEGLDHARAALASWQEGER